MANGEHALLFSAQENIREQQFRKVWVGSLDDAFTDLAQYYDRANRVASLGLWSWFHKCFISTIEVKSSHKVLDLCAGTNAIGIALLKKQQDLEVHAVDRSNAMQTVGQQSAHKQGMHIDSTICDVHDLPFPDNYFDVVTLQFASRHLRIMHVSREVERVLKPGGYFYHCDMLRPASKIVAWSYYAYLRFCMNLTALIFRSSTVAHGCKQYFIDALRMFYSADEFTDLLGNVGFQNISSQTLLGGMIGYHKAMKPFDA